MALKNLHILFEVYCIHFAHQFSSIEILTHDLQLVNPADYSLKVNPVIEDMSFLQRFQKLAQFSHLLLLQQNITQFKGKTNSQGHHAQPSQIDQDVECIFANFQGKRIDEAGHEPLEDPHWYIDHEQLEEVKIELIMLPFEDVFEEDAENVVQREAIFIQPQQHASFVDRYVNKYPERIALWVPYQDKKGYNKIHALSISCFRKENSYSFQHILKNLPFLFRQLECSI